MRESSGRGLFYRIRLVDKIPHRYLFILSFRCYFPLLLSLALGSFSLLLPALFLLFLRFLESVIAVGYFPEDDPDCRGVHENHDDMELKEHH